MKTKFNKIVALVLFACIAFLAIIVISTATKPAYAATADSEKLYGENVYGASTEEDVSYKVYCDSTAVVESTSHYSAPAYKNFTSLTNACGPITGVNLVGFYDRWYENLIPDFTPGFLIQNNYVYSPLTTSAVTSALSELGSLMKTAELGGTTSTNFKNGLQTYANSRGYSFSYDSFYQNSKSVNFQKLISAVNAGKVGVLMLSEYNFVTSINVVDGYVSVAKYKSSYNHMLLVYGYEVREYYQNGAVIRRDTFLRASNGSNTGISGYVQLDDYLTIDEALIITIS